MRAANSRSAPERLRDRPFGRMPTAWRRRGVALGLLALVAAAPAGADENPLPANALGVDVEAAAGTAPAAAAGATGGAAGPGTEPLVARVGIAWSILETAPGEYRWEILDPVVAAATEAGREIILNLHGRNPVYTGAQGGISPEEERALEGWTACLRALAARYGEKVRLYQVGRWPDRSAGNGPLEAARDYAFLFKRSAVALRSADADARVALGTIEPASLEFAAALFEEEVAAYADALAVSFDGTEAARDALARLSGLLLANDPSARLWITDVQLLLGAEGYGQLLRAYTAALDREAALITFRDPPDQQGRPFHIAALERTRALFDPSYAPLVESGRGVRVLSGSGTPMTEVRPARFFSPDEKKVLMLYQGEPRIEPGQFAVFILDTVDVADPVLYDLAAGESSSNVAIQKDTDAGATRLALPLAPYPLVLAYRRFTTPEFALEGERLAVTGERIPSAEEIIARHQAAQAAQDALLRNVRAEGEETWHFSIGTGGSLDVTFKVGFFLDPNVGAEWEQREIYVNGVRWKTERIPKLPLVVSEQVLTLPLQINLSREYAYAYAGREEVEERDCYVIVFRPIDETKNLARGKAWIDTKTFMRVRLAQVQDNLTEPLVSNDQRDTYGPVTGPDGFTYWLLSRVDAQTIYTTVGRTFVINKEVRLRDHVINGPEFDGEREAALASSHTMLRDTEEGLRYLVQAPGGGRVVQRDVFHRNTFILGGVFYNRAVDFPVPLAGINYLDTDLFGRGLQTNIFFAGPFLFGSVSDPSLFGLKLDANVDLSASAIPFTDRVVIPGPGGDLAEREAAEITARTQSLVVGLGYPFAKHFKLKWETGLSYVDYGRTDETAEAFITPRDTYVRTDTLIGEFNRRALSVALRHSWSRRQRNDPWGIPPRDFSEDARDYALYDGAISKEFYLPSNQKVRVSVSGMGGRDQDRFSKYRFGFFENRMRGFSGSGVHFTHGTLGNIEYAFNLADIVRFEGAVQHAHVKDRQLDTEFRDYTGFGFSGQMVGSWGLIYRLDWGIALRSDVPEFEGEQEVLFTVLKLFSQR